MLKLQVPHSKIVILTPAGMFAGVVTQNLYIHIFSRRRGAELGLPVTSVFLGFDKFRYASEIYLCEFYIDLCLRLYTIILWCRLAFTDL